MIARLLGHLGLDYCATCGWWTAPAAATDRPTVRP